MWMFGIFLLITKHRIMFSVLSIDDGLQAVALKCKMYLADFVTH